MIVLSREVYKLLWFGGCRKPLNNGIRQFYIYTREWVRW